MRILLPLLLLTTLLCACSQKKETGVEGTLLFSERPLAGAQVEVYLRGDKDRSTQPFAVASTDSAGRYRLTLPPGRYFLIGKKKDEAEDGRVRMLMADCPANPVEVTSGMRHIPPFAVREMGRDGALVPAPGTGVTGRVTVDGTPLSGAFVYVYTDPDSGLAGPSYGAAVRTEEDGTFSVGLPAGRYWLAARQRADGSRVGEPSAGDLNGAYPGNPVEVELGQTVNLGELPLRKVDPAAHDARMAKGKFQPTGTGFTGRVVDPDGRPLGGLYVFAYLDSRMTGKPAYISAPTGHDGRFVLHLGNGGTYYLGARSAFGGPLEPGEWIGTYDKDPRHAAATTKGKMHPLGDITVREAW